MMKKTLVLGTSLKPERYSNLAVNRLLNNGIETEAFGLREGNIRGVDIKTDFKDFEDIHTVTLYIGQKHQSQYIENIIRLKPERVIFNPGTENPELYDILEKNGITSEVACTLVLLGTGQY